MAAMFGGSEDRPDFFGSVFDAVVTATAPGSGAFASQQVYAWSEQTLAPSSGALAAASPGRSGTFTQSPALEMNGQVLTSFPVFVQMRLRGMAGGMPVYEFQSPQSSASLTSEYSNSKAAVSPTTVLQFDPAGFTLTSGPPLAPGVQRVSLVPTPTPTPTLKYPVQFFTGQNATIPGGTPLVPAYAWVDQYAGEQTGVAWGALDPAYPTYGKAALPLPALSVPYLEWGLYITYTYGAGLPFVNDAFGVTVSALYAAAGPHSGQQDSIGAVYADNGGGLGVMASGVLRNPSDYDALIVQIDNADPSHSVSVSGGGLGPGGQNLRPSLFWMKAPPVF